MDKLPRHTDAIQPSGSGSEYSDLSALEDDTDEFGRKLFQQYRQQRPVERNPDGRPQAFRKARRGPTLSERLGRPLPGNPNTLASGHARTASSGSTQSDPPLNIPQHWGRRERRESDWTRQRETRGETGIARNAAQSEVHRQERESNVVVSSRPLRPIERTPALDYRDEPLASLEHTPPSMRRRRTEDTPSSMHHMNTTIQQVMETEDHDFTAMSLLASTPPVNNRHRKIDEIARQEIESFERRTRHTRTQEAVEPVVEEIPPHTAPLREQFPLPSRRRSVILNKENLRPNGGAPTDLKETTGLANRSKHAVTFKNTQRQSDHNRGDSYNLLRQLARVSSLSPSPARKDVKPETAEGRPKSEPITRSRHHIKNEPPLEDAQPQHIKLEPVGVPLGIDVTPARREKLGDAQTPVITGAWVNTPVTTNPVRSLRTENSQKPDGEPSRKPIEGSKSSQIKPVHAKSALADIIAEARNQPGALFGDGTIQSLENLLGEDINLADGLTQADRDQRQEDLAIEAMDKHLQSARKSIKNANRGLQRVENKMEASQIGMESMYEPAQENLPAANVKNPPLIAVHDHSHCAHCGGANQSIWAGLWTEFRRCFYTWDPTSPSSIRFTWLGLICALWLTWFITEQILCWNYCRPLYGENFEDIDLPWDMPLYPYVLPTLLFRPFKWLWEPAYDYLAWCSGALFHSWIGEEAVSAEPAIVMPAHYRAGSAATKKAFTNTYRAAEATVATAVYSTRMVQSVVDAVDEVGSMWDDEFL